MDKYVIYTSIVGNRDSLLDEQVCGSAKFIAFTNIVGTSRTWQIVQPYLRFQSARRNARTVKVLAHLFVEAEYSMWIDGRVSMLCEPTEFIENALLDCDIATFRHYKRNCLYQEAEECAARSLDHPALIKEQVNHYRAAGLAEGLGLPETSILIRRHNQTVEMFNNIWWAEICRYCVRDQISFMFAAARSGAKVKLMDVNSRNRCFHLVPRMAQSEIR